MAAARADRPWKVSPAKVARQTVNPIREIVDHLRVEPNKEKEMISLAQGDPTIYGNLKIADECVNAVVRALQSYKANGYPASAGYESARAAVASKYSTPEAPLSAHDVFITSGCSHALDLAISALCEEGSNLLMPRPGFSLYQTLAQSKSVECRYYNLLPSQSWEVDLKHLESLIDEKTAAVVVNNPSNPCGSVYSQKHLEDVIALCEKYKLVIIADEIYADMAWGGSKFIPMARLSKNVPILTAGGLAKQYLVPGWRLGWLLVHDRNNVLSEIRRAIMSLTQLILGANSVVQAALHDILHRTPASFYEKTLQILEHNAKISASVISRIPGLTVVVPQGAMYMMVGINLDQFKDIKDDVDFVEKLVTEESVLCLPGRCFQYPNFFRLVFAAPPAYLEEAFKRMAQFCSRHRK